MNIIKLPAADLSYQTDIVRFHNSMIDSHKKDKSMFFRRDAVLVMNPVTGGKVVRYAMGNSGIKGLTKDSVAIDYDAAVELNVKFGDPCSVLVRRAKTHEVISWFLHHKDLNVRISMRLSILSVLLGFAGLVAGFS